MRDPSLPITQRFLAGLVGSLLTTVGLVFFWKGIPHTCFVMCDRTSTTQINCLYQETVLWWIPLKRASLENLQAVQLQEGENAYDGTVYLIFLDGATNDLTFGNSLSREAIANDIQEAQTFLSDRAAQSLYLHRYEADWLFAILGLPLVYLGLWIVLNNGKSFHPRNP